MIEITQRNKILFRTLLSPLQVYYMYVFINWITSKHLFIVPSISQEFDDINITLKFHTRIQSINANSTSNSLTRSHRCRVSIVYRYNIDTISIRRRGLSLMLLAGPSTIRLSCVILVNNWIKCPWEFAVSGCMEIIFDIIISADFKPD